MNKLIVNIKHAFTTNALLHGALYAALAGLASVLIPILNQGGLPTETQVWSALKLAVGGGLLYILKNVIAGSSNTLPPANNN